MMIIKDKSIVESNSVKVLAGQKQELDVAFYLRRAFKNSKNIHVFNDLKFTFNDEVAQIDHLILYPYGFILIESKSINGEVKVNSLGEWSRSYKGKWQGISSPIKQVELQQGLLKTLLHDKRREIIPKFLFNLKQQTFAGRCWHNLCAVSSSAIINREDIPKDISKLLVKSEFLVDKVTELMNIKNVVMRKINIADTRPDFSQSEIESISKFIFENHLNVNDETKADLAESVKHITPPEIKKSHKIACKKCGLSNSLETKSGRYGYYAHCCICDTNTALKRDCLDCGDKKTKVSKTKNIYTLNCTECNSSHQLTV